MNQDSKTWLDQVVNVHIYRDKKRLCVGFTNTVPLLDREYRVMEYLMREPDLTKRQRFHDIARGAFAETEMVPMGAVKVILEQTKRSLVAKGAYRGFLVMTETDVQLYAPEPSVKVTAFHVPGAHFRSGPVDGSQQFSTDEVQPVWEGQITQKADSLICEDAFRFLNQDDRPNGRFAPSLSVGDLVTIAGGTVEAVTYQVAGAGWLRLRTPVHPDSDAVEAMKKQLTGRPQTLALNT